MGYYVRPDGLHESIRKIGGHRIAFRGKSDEEVDKKIKAYHQRQARGKRFDSVRSEYEEEMLPQLEYTTQRGYNAPLHHASKFDYYPIREITRMDIKNFVAQLAKQGYAKKTISNILIVIRQIFKFALDRGYIDNDPSVGISLPKTAKTSRRESATPDEENIIKNSKTLLLPFFVLYTGCRKGEALAMRWENIDFDRNIIYVTQSAYAVGTKVHIKEPKTEQGVRAIPLLEPLKERLSAYTNKTGYVFSSDGGKTPQSIRSVEYAYDKFCRENNLHCTLHQLRHSYATMLYENGIDVKSAQHLLGHANIATTEDIYTHFRQAQLSKITEKLNKSNYTVHPSKP